MAIDNSLGATIALVQLGLAVDALSNAVPQFLMQAKIFDQSGEPLRPEEALRQVEYGLAQIRRRLTAQRLRA